MGLQLHQHTAHVCKNRVLSFRMRKYAQTSSRTPTLRYLMRTSSLLLAAARCSAVWPCSVTARRSAPAPSSSFTIGAWPFSAAETRGVCPDEAGRCTEACASSSREATSNWPCCDATLRAVHPKSSCKQGVTAICRSVWFVCQQGHTPPTPPRETVRYRGAPPGGQRIWLLYYYVIREQSTSVCVHPGHAWAHVPAKLPDCPYMTTHLQVDRRLAKQQVLHNLRNKGWTLRSIIIPVITLRLHVGGRMLLSFVEACLLSGTGMKLVVPSVTRPEDRAYVHLCMHLLQPPADSVPHPICSLCADGAFMHVCTHPTCVSPRCAAQCSLKCGLAPAAPSAASTSACRPRMAPTSGVSPVALRRSRIEPAPSSSLINQVRGNEVRADLHMPVFREPRSCCGPLFAAQILQQGCCCCLLANCLSTIGSEGSLVRGVEMWPTFPAGGTDNTQAELYLDGCHVSSVCRHVQGSVPRGVHLIELISRGQQRLRTQVTADDVR